MKRHKVNSAMSKKLFSSTASRMHKKNIGGNPLRGGIRL